MSLLRVDRLQRRFGGVRAVDGVSFALAAGEVAALIGPNGAGKTTLFNVIDGQLAADAGEVFYDGRSLAAAATAQRTRMGIGRTFQVAQAFGTMTTLQNAQLAAVAARGEYAKLGAPLWRREHDAARGLLQQVGLLALADQPAAVLAYGDLKRLELALALAATPRLMLMDEPTAGMAPGERTALMRLVVELARQRNMAVLFTEHSMDVVFGFAERVLVLARGQLVADGAPEAVRADPEVQRIYLGDDS
jgi:ABC-type branched-subunit amino acid transport system ATPase component